MRNVEIAKAADQQRLQVRVVPAAPLPRRVQPHARARGVPRPTAPAQTERVHLGSAIFNITPPVNKPVRIAENVALLDHLTEQPLRVRHRPGLVDHRGATASTSPTSTRPRRCGGETIREIPKMWKDGHLLLRGHVLPHARAQGLPEAARPAAPGHVGGGRLAPAPSPRPASWASAPSASPSARPSADRAAGQGLQGRRSATPRPSATTSTTTSWASPTCSAWRTATRPSRSPPTWA